ncbi:hypothetical protein B4Q13_20115, partial [Lacticaseibacillus rhamnosus]
EVVDEPLGGRRDGAFFLDGLCDGAIGSEQHARVVGEPRQQRAATARVVGDTLGGRQTLCVLLESFDAEELGANRLFGVGKEGCVAEGSALGGASKFGVYVGVVDAVPCGGAGAAGWGPKASGLSSGGGRRVPLPPRWLRKACQSKGTSTFPMSKTSVSMLIRQASRDKLETRPPLWRIPSRQSRNVRLAPDPRIRSRSGDHDRA